MDLTALDFDSIRPYNDSETVEAIARMVRDSSLDKALEYLALDKNIEEVRSRVSSFTSVQQFQDGLMLPMLDALIKRTSAELTFSGLENLNDGKSHLLLSAHRDIILDPAIIQYILARNGLPYSEIAVGDNLLGSSFVEDCMRSNRMIKVLRGCSGREKYMASITLSNYIRNRVSGGECSVWIAHRGGRTKDGMDTTGQGVLKMLWLSHESDFCQAFESLSIVPVSISYEFESCDFLKAREIFFTRRGPYQKKDGEDMQSMITGLTQWKGNIHFHFSPVLGVDEIARCNAYDKNERFAELGVVVDSEVRSNFRLWPNNYIAYDLLHGSNEFADYYTQEQKEKFIVYAENGLDAIVKENAAVDYKELRDIFLLIYANPVTFKR